MQHDNPTRRNRLETTVVLLIITMPGELISDFFLVDEDLSEPDTQMRVHHVEAHRYCGADMQQLFYRIVLANPTVLCMVPLLLEVAARTAFDALDGSLHVP